ncbi:MAG: hypothetical protein RL291_1366 [Pseudomonadota bacterium]
MASSAGNDRALNARQRRRRSRDRAARGFSILEITLAIALLAGLTMMVTSSFAPAVDRARLTAEVREIRAVLATVRTRAITENRTMGAMFDARGNRIIYGEPALERILPPGVTLSLPRDGETGADGLRRVVFFPDGGSSGGRVLISDGRRTQAIAIDWLSGTIQVSAGASHAP